MARASGCSEADSSVTASCSSVASSSPVAGSTSVTAGSPRVRVPVLSSTRTLSFSAASRASALRIRIPAFAARPMPTISAVGVARPSAQGHAITSTATAGTSAPSKVPDTNHQAANVMAASPTTTGTNTAETWSTSFCTGGLEPCAAATRRMMPESSVSRPVPEATHFSSRMPLTVPANTRLPGALSTGMLSPVSMASSTAESPSTTRPSSAMASPGRTTKASPGWSVAIDTSTSRPSFSTHAVLGCRRTSASSARAVRALARASRNLPRSTSVTTAAEASKYRCSGRPRASTATEKP